MPRSYKPAGKKPKLEAGNLKKSCILAGMDIEEVWRNVPTQSKCGLPWFSSGRSSRIPR